MPDRLPCCIPACRSIGTTKPYTEWICSRHWGLIPKQQKRAYRRAWNRANGLEWRDAGANAAVARLWKWCKKHASDARFQEFM